MQAVSLFLVFGCIIASIQSLPHGSVFDSYKRPFDLGTYRPFGNRFFFPNIHQNLKDLLQLAKKHGNLVESAGKGAIVLNIQGNKRVVKVESGVNPDGVKYWKDFEDLFVDGQTFHTERVYNFETKELETKTTKVEKKSVDKDAVPAVENVPESEKVAPVVENSAEEDTLVPQPEEPAQEVKNVPQPEEPAQEVESTPENVPVAEPVDTKVEDVAEKEKVVPQEEPAEEVVSENAPVAAPVEPQAEEKVPEEEQAVTEAASESA